VRTELPKLAADEARCWSCHEGGAVSRERAAALCLHCHGEGTGDAQVATARVSKAISAAAYQRTSHAGVACVTCHPAAAAYGHAHQAEGNCAQCHTPHYAQARDPHVNVDCRACHVNGGRVVLDAATHRVVREPLAGPGPAARTHDLVRHPSRQSCERCHFGGNRLGASAMVLPAKSILCVGCHAATLSVNDAVTIPSLAVFLLGLGVAMSLWLSGAGNMIGGLKTVFSPRILWALESLLADTVLQRRLLRRSTARWVIHSLIFLPFLIRFAWGAVALAASWSGARGAWFAVLIDKNHPVNALLFDLTGLSVLVGVCAAIARGMATRRQRLPGLPGQGHAALAAIGSVVVIGFVLEGMRMAMTGVSGGAAFLGYAISRAFTAGPGMAAAPHRARRQRHGRHQDVEHPAEWKVGHKRAAQSMERAVRESGPSAPTITSAVRRRAPIRTASPSTAETAQLVHSVAPPATARCAMWRSKTPRFRITPGQVFSAASFPAMYVRSADTLCATAASGALTSPARMAGMYSAHCTGKPTWRRRSSIKTRSPARAMGSAADAPAGPAPITMASQWSVIARPREAPILSPEGAG
jgi:hypothetical protein